MKLILSSCDFRNDNARKAIIDNLNKPISQCKLLYIPNEKATFESIHSDLYYLRMEEFGFTRNNVYVFDYYNADAFWELDIDVLYISGGNTFATIDRLRKCNFENEIIRYVKSGVIYIGGSAGAHIASQNIEHVANFDPVPEGLTDFHGLGLFDGILICHYTEERKALYDKLKAEGKYKVFALSNDDYLVVSDKDDVNTRHDLLIDKDTTPVHDPEPQTIDFSKITPCGGCCDDCAHFKNSECRGCIASDGKCIHMWQGDNGVCKVFSCCKNHGVSFCGLCKEFPCKWLEEWFSTWNKDGIANLMTMQIETYIEQNLSGEMRQTALDFARYLKANGLTFYKDTSNCWKDKIYYWVKLGDECVCFIAIADPEEPDNLWTVWSDSSSAYEDESISDEIKNTGWRYVDHCGNCGSCGGGKEKIIFGKSFPRVCGCTFRIDNASKEDLPFLKTMVDLRIKELLKNDTAR